jgi:ABC-2 type transport system permease protein
MDKIRLIIGREFRTRFQSRSFLLITFLAPFFYLLLIAAPALLQQAGQEETLVRVFDEAQQFLPHLKDQDDLRFVAADQDIGEAREAIRQGKAESVLLYIPRQDMERPGNIQLMAGQKVGPTTTRAIERQLNRIIENHRLTRRGIDPEELEAIKPELELDTIVLSKGGAQEASAGAAAAAGFGAGFLIYIFIFIYGNFVLRGVQEEKTNRIVEIILSSVRPIQLMLGKIGGVFLVGLAQLGIWAAMILLLSLGASFFFGDLTPAAAGGGPLDPGAQSVAPQATQAQSETAREIAAALATIDLGGLLLAFLFYFMGGYLVYAALYAAIAAAVDDQAELTQFVLPISIPVIVSLVSVPAIIEQPHGTLAYALSMIPLTSPVTMLARIPFDVPFFELLLSGAILLSFAAGVLGMGAKIYRVGILWYGKKINYRELFRWLKMR